MVRTKVSRNTASKRNRTSYQEERHAHIMREFEIVSETFIMSLDAKLDADLKRIDYQTSMIRNRIPKEILQMTMGDLRKTGCNLFVDVLNMSPADGESAGNCSQLSNGSADAQTSFQKSYRTDEGYLTEECAKRSLDVMASAKPSKRPMGPLASAMKSNYARRRSNSVSGHTTTPSKPAQPSMLFGIKGKRNELRTPAIGKNIFMGQSERFSRPKLRTPLAQVNNKSRSQAVSTDRGMSQITLKVEPNTPLAFIRYPRAGESVYSLTGSPVVNAVMTKHTANVNIPVPDGVLSLQPTDLEDVDKQYLPKIDYATLEHLKKLQSNLNKIMQYAEECNFRMNQ
ncbi:borealin-like [Anopheles stephensi]|uniref:Borealin C-terminal domain-containing protein n=1 Tax=Anopheles stephensi TaxID=30069 RepID=A0A182YEA1_ANOST|nr:borealin-like [Anopheles stephensi]